MKKKHIGKRMLAIFFALAFCLSLLPITAMAAGTTYTVTGPVTEAPKTGEKYLIVGLQSSDYYAMTSSIGKYKIGSSIGTEITLDDTSCIWEAEVANGKIKFKNGNDYLKGNGNETDMTTVVSASATEFTWNNGHLEWEPAMYTTCAIRFYDPMYGTNNKFRAYYSNAANVSFYKLTEAQTQSYNISIAQGIEHGSVSVVGGATTAAEGDTITLSASPDSGYELDAYSVKQGDAYVTVTNGSFEMPAGDVTVSATFKEIPPTTYSITIAQTTNGTVTADKATAAADDTVTLTVTPDSGYKLGTLTATSGGNSVAVENNAFTMPAGDVTVTATFVEDTPVVVAQKAYKEVTSLTAGKNYLIASGNSDTVQLLSYASGSLGKVAAEVENGIIELSDPASCVWTVDGTANTDFQLVNQGTTYLTGNASLATSATRPSRENDSWKWNTTNGELGFGNSGYYKLKFQNNDFRIHDQGENVHFFEEIPTFSAHQLVLTGQLGLIFKMDLSCLTADEIAAGTMSFSINSGDPVEVAGTAEGNGKYAFTCVVNALQMADTITATYTYGEGKTVTDTYSVNDYLNEILASNNAALVKYQPLAEAIKDYGHYAQTYLAGVHDFEIGTDYTAMDPVHNTLTTLTDDQLAAIKPSLVKGESGVSGLAIKLSLESETALTIRPVVGGSDVAEGTVSFLGNTINFENGKVVVPNIKAAQLAEKATISATVGGKALSGEVSALSYAYVVLKDNSSSADLKNLAIALYNYYAEISKL